ncbi:hypothetical protein BS50DRAFT_86413 [Corynespora cassiicola Philippines]|uniref:Uncharacterized protein n=1 Tax=Corynespora cassiicola Philippines TaxID=1448308 RepID=A0A2T2NE61_CORCC|nr:hypothetical protein BS50DRAFT_86413 [Corynespora cassiicola Philippines]
MRFTIIRLATERASPTRLPLTAGRTSRSPLSENASDSTVAVSEFNSASRLKASPHVRAVKQTLPKAAPRVRPVGNSPPASPPTHRQSLRRHSHPSFSSSCFPPLTPSIGIVQAPEASSQGIIHTQAHTTLLRWANGSILASNACPFRRVPLLCRVDASCTCILLMSGVKGAPRPRSAPPERGGKKGQGKQVPGE